MAVYSAFKGAITQFTKSFALEMGRHQVRVNAIAPEKTQTLQMWSDAGVTADQRRLVPYWIPIGRLGVPDDIAGTAVYLASDLSPLRHRHHHSHRWRLLRGRGLVPHQ